MSKRAAYYIGDRHPNSYLCLPQQDKPLSLDPQHKEAQRNVQMLARQQAQR